MTHHRYWVYGLSIASELALPELEGRDWYIDTDFVDRQLALAGESPDVEIVLGAVPSAPDDPPNRWFFVRADGTAVFRVANAASFAISAGKRVVMELTPGCDPSLPRQYLLGSALGIALHQRGDVPLHAGVPVVNGKAWAFTAASGTGKSTLMAGLNLLAQLPLLGDDVVVLRRRADGTPLIFPGPPMIKLDKPAFDAVRHRSVEVLPEYVGAPKQRVRAAKSFLAAPLPLAGIVLLHRDESAVGEGLRLERVVGAAAFSIAEEAMYRIELATYMVPKAALFQRLASLAAEVPMYRGGIVPLDLCSPEARAHMIRGVLERATQA